MNNAQIALLVRVFFGEKLMFQNITGILLAFIGALIVQLQPNQQNDI